MSSQEHRLCPQQNELVLRRGFSIIFLVVVALTSALVWDGRKTTSSGTTSKVVELEDDRPSGNDASTKSALAGLGSTDMNTTKVSDVDDDMVPAAFSSEAVDAYSSGGVDAGYGTESLRHVRSTDMNTTKVSDVDDDMEPSGGVDAAYGTESLRHVRKCIAEILPTCNNHGLDRCQWRPSTCGFGQVNNTQFANVFANKAVVFHGDSTLRELFSAWSYYCCPSEAAIDKIDTNMSSRTVVSRFHRESNMRSYFRFDYLFDHLSEPLRETSGTRVDVVVLGLGLYHAKGIATNETDAVSFDEIKLRLAPKIVPLVCDVHKAKIGLFMSSWMECAAMKRHKSRSVRQNHQVCSQSSQALSVINRVISMALAKQQPREDGCHVHFVRPFRCTKVRHPCTGDGVHARSGSEYGNSRFSLLVNSMKLALGSR